MRLSKPRNRAALAVLACAVAAVFVLPASSASAGSATVSNACANSVTPNFSQIEVTTSGDDGLTAVAPSSALTLSGLSQSAAIPGDIFVAGYNLGLLVAGVNNIPANVQTKIEATNTVEGVQNTNVVGGSPPNGSVTLSTTITDPDGSPGTGDETATDASFSVAYSDLNWTAGGSGTMEYRQDSIAAWPATDANNTLRIQALIGGFLTVTFRCAPGTVTPPDPGTVALIDPAPSFDTTNTCLAPTLISIDDQTVAEGGEATFTVSQAGCPSSLPVDFATSDGTAIAPGDYTPTSGTLTLTPGDPSETVTVQTNQDAFDESDETFNVNLFASGGEVIDNLGVGTILNVVDGHPTANAGPDQTVFTGDLVSLDGTASSDPAGQPLTYNWTQTGGPSVTLSDPTSTTPSFTAPAVPATLEFQLEVCDPDAMCDTDTVAIIVLHADADAAGEVIVNGPVTSTKTSKSFVFKVSNHGTVPITVDPATDITGSVDVNGMPTGSVSPNSGTKTLSPGASTRFKLVWSYPAGSLATGDSVVFHACVDVPGDIDTTNDCVSASAVAK